MSIKIGADVEEHLPPIISACSVIKLERELDDSWTLRRVNDTHVTSKRGTGSVEVDVVKGVDEVALETQLHSLCDLEALLQAQIEIGVARPNNWSLRRTRAKDIGWIGVRCGIEPLVANECSAAGIKCRFSSKRSASPGVAIGTQSAAARAGDIAVREVEIIQRNREARVDGDDRVD